MESKNAEVIFQTRSTVDRRRVNDRRLFHKQEYIGYNSERRENMFGRRVNVERRKVLPDAIVSFWKEIL